MNMQSKLVKCPNCNAKLNVQNSKNEEEKLIKCKNCGIPLKVIFAPQQAPLVAHTYIAPPKNPPVDGGATQLAGGNNGATILGGAMSGATQLGPSPKKESSPRLVFNDLPYFLKEGQNIIGRKANTSKATVQIDTADRYMSRQHCAIKVTTLPDGTKKVVLSNYQNKNRTIVDGQEIATGDEIRLIDGDRITMGHTTIIFKL